MTKMIIYTKGTVKIVENPSIVEKFQLTEESAIEGIYCITIANIILWKFYEKNISTVKFVTEKLFGLNCKI